jgi:hypothetical protein
VIYYEFDEELSRTAQQSIEDETNLILAAMNWRLEWRPISGSSLGYTSTDLVFVQFRGKCDSSEPLRYVCEVGRLGWTYENNGKVLPYTKVDCDHILKVIRHHLPEFKPLEWDRIVGRAIGRVVAHELYHVFSRSSRHSPKGVSQAFFSANDLIRPALRIEESYIRPENGAPVVGEVSRTEDGGDIYASSVCSGCHGARGEIEVAGRTLANHSLRRNFLSLMAQLSNKGSKMFRAARRQGRLWKPFTEREIQQLAAFLNGLGTKPGAHEAEAVASH